MNLLLRAYNLLISLFQLGIPLFASHQSKLAVRHKAEKENWKKIQSFAASRESNKKLIWMHCASLGEFEQGQPILSQIRATHGDNILTVLSFLSPSGFDQKKDEKLADLVIYLPIDTVKNSNKIVSTLKPDIFIGVKYEFWWNLIQTLQNNRCAVMWIALKISKKHYFLNPFASPFLNLLRRCEHLFVQDHETFRLLTAKGFDNVSIAGDPRIERIFNRRRSNINTPRYKFPQNYQKIVIYGSVYSTDFERIGNAVMKHPDYYHIIVPHDVSKVGIRKIANCLSIPIVTLAEIHHSINYVIVDRVGLLFDLYLAADIAYVGGGFGKGIHNVLEPLSCGLPVGFGPQHRAFKEAEELLQIGLAQIVENENIFDHFITNYSKNGTTIKKAEEYFIQNCGATQIICRYIDQFI